MSKKAEERGFEALPPRWRKTKDGKGKIDSVLPVRKFYIKAYEQAEKDIIERACNWLFSHLPILVDYYNEDIHEKADRSEFIKLFRTEMEEYLYEIRGRDVELLHAAQDLVDTVERYVEPKPGQEFVHRSEILLKKNALKELLK